MPGLSAGEPFEAGLFAGATPRLTALGLYEDLPVKADRP
jgi:hypothetical protein